MKFIGNHPLPLVNLVVTFFFEGATGETQWEELCAQRVKMYDYDIEKKTPNTVVLKKLIKNIHGSQFVADTCK